MEKYDISNDIPVFCVKAVTFPDGVKAAFRGLLELIPNSPEQTKYGISYPGSTGDTIYYAAAEESFPGEGRQKGCETFTIKKGSYTGELIRDWQKDEKQIAKTFRKILDQPGTDRNGYCLEIYSDNKDVRCLVPDI